MSNQNSDEFELEDLGESSPKKGFRGGRKKQRDAWYGYDDSDFQRWWHRSPDGKRAYGGQDIANAETARQIYEDWVEKGKPQVK